MPIPETAVVNENIMPIYENIMPIYENIMPIYEISICVVQ
jgi:hypothetical protein